MLHFSSKSYLSSKYVKLVVQKQIKFEFNNAAILFTIRPCYHRNECNVIIEEANVLSQYL